MGKNSIKGITIEIGGSTTKLDKALDDVSKKSKNLQSELKEVNKLLKFDPHNTELVTQKQILLKQAIAETKSKLDTLKTAEKQVQTQFEKGEVSEEQYRALQREIINTENTLKKLETEASTTNKVLEGISTTVGKVGNAASAASQKLAPLSTAAAGLLTASATAAASFENAMAKVSTIADTTEVPLSELSNQIIQLSDNTGLASADIADAVYNAISAGQSTGDAVNFVAASSKLATAGFTSTAASTDILTTALNAYGLSASKVTNISDMLITTQNLGKTTVDELASSMGKVIPTANANNVAFDQLGTAYAQMTAKGIATAESTTYLNSMLNELGKGGTKVDAILRDGTGKSFSELMADGNSLADVLEILQEVADDAGMSFSDLWSSSEAGKAALVLLGDGADEFNSTLEEMRGSTGATDAAYDKMHTTTFELKKVITQLKNVLIELGTTLLAALQPAITTITAKVKDFKTWFDGLSKSQQMTILKVIALVAALAPALAIIGKVCTGVQTAIKVMQGVKTAIIAAKGAMSGLNAVLKANPVFIVIAAITALIAIFVVLYNHCESFRNKVNEIIEFLKPYIEAAIQNLKDSIQAIWETIQTVWSFIQPYLLAAWETIKSIFAAVQPYFQALWETIKGIFSVVSTTLGGFFSDAWTAIKVIWDVVSPFFQALWETIKGIFSVVSTTLGGFFSVAWTAIKAVWNTVGGFFKTVWNTIKGIFSVVKAVLSGDFSGAWEAIKGIFASWGSFFSGLWSSIKSVFSSVGTWFKSIFTTAWTAIKGVFSSWGSFFGGLWDTIKDKFSSLGTSISNAIGGAVKSGINGIISTIENIINGAISLINGAIGLINKIPGVSVGTIGEVSLPRLAKGGILRSGQAMVAEAGPEIIQMVNGETIVTPLTNGARNRALEEFEGKGGNNQTYNQTVNIQSQKELSPSEIAKQTRRATRQMISNIKKR